MAYDAGGLVVVRDKVKKEIETLTLQKPHTGKITTFKNCVIIMHALIILTAKKKLGMFIMLMNEFIS